MLLSFEPSLEDISPPPQCHGNVVPAIREVPTAYTAGRVNLADVPLDPELCIFRWFPNAPETRKKALIWVCLCLGHPPPPPKQNINGGSCDRGVQAGEVHGRRGARAALRWRFRLRRCLMESRGKYSGCTTIFALASRPFAQRKIPLSGLVSRAREGTHAPNRSELLRAGLVDQLGCLHRTKFLERGPAGLVDDVHKGGPTGSETNKDTHTHTHTHPHPCLHSHLHAHAHLGVIIFFYCHPFGGQLQRDSELKLFWGCPTLCLSRQAVVSKLVFK